MRQFRQFACMAFCAAAVVAMLAASANAQGQGGGRRGGMMGGGGGGFGRLGLVGSEQVQKELELVDDQKAAVQKLRDEARDEMRAAFDGGGGDREAMQKKMTELREKNEKKLQAILLPDQYDRLKQLDLQVQGANALADKETADALALSDDQKSKLAAIREEFQTKRGELFQGGGGGGGGGNPERRAKMEELRKTEGDQMLAVLTPEQKTKFESMKGKIVEIDRSQLGFGGGGGGRRGGGQGGGQGGNTP